MSLSTRDEHNDKSSITNECYLLNKANIAVEHVFNDLFSFIEMNSLKDRFTNEITNAISYEWLVKTVDKLYECLQKDGIGIKREKFPIEFINRNLRDLSYRSPNGDPSIPFAINRKLSQLSSLQENGKTPEMPFKSIAFLTSVCTDGFGDLVHCNLTAKLFKEIWPDLSIYMIIVINAGERREKAKKIINGNHSNCDHAVVEYVRRDGYVNYSVREIFKEIDAFIDVSYRVPNYISERINELAKPGSYRAFWGEISTPLFSGHYQWKLFESLKNVSVRQLRLGLELGIRFEKEIDKFKKMTDSLSFNDAIKFFSDSELSKLLIHNDNQCPLLFMGYFRRSINLIRFCKIILNLYSDNKYVLNIFVKEKPTLSELRQLAKVQCIELYSENDFQTITVGQHGPILRLISRKMSYSDSNLIVAMSQLVGCGGDNSYFQALSTSALPFMEKMSHDSIFFPYLLFLIKEYKLDTNLSLYFDLLNQFTSSTSFDSNEEHLANQILDLLQPPKKAKLQSAYSQFIEILRQKHNMETVIKGINNWYTKEDVWVDDAKDANKQHVIPRLQHKYMFWKELKKSFIEISAADREVIDAGLQDENIAQTIDEYLGEAVFKN